jgi:pre-mRNA-splicing factor SYF1
MDYCDLMVRRGLVTETRRVFDRAIRALPVTQHMRIWPKYVDFLLSHNIPETTIRVFRRYLKIYPAAREEFVDYLVKIDKLDEAASELVILVNEDKEVSPQGKTSFQVTSFAFYKS